MDFWIKDSELEVFRLNGSPARFYLRRISRAAMIKAQEIEELRAIELTSKDERQVTREQRALAAEQQAEHDAKPLDERLDAELRTQFGLHDRKTVLDFGLVRWELDTDDGVRSVKRSDDGVDWIEDLAPEACELIFRELIRRNAVLPSRLKA